MNQLNKKTKVKWDLFLSEISHVEQMIRNAPVFSSLENIYAIPRGGLIMGVILSHKFDIPMIFDASKITHKTLVVDDISDRGVTLRKIIGDKNPTIAVLYQKANSSLKSKFFARYVGDDEWIQFPFETVESSKLDNTI